MLSIRELRENKLIIKYASYPFNTFGFEVRSHLQSSAYEDKEVKSLSRVRLFATPWTVAYQALHSWDSPGKNTRVGCHFLLHGIFLTQESN